MPFKCISPEEVVICNECGFMDTNAHCLYNECPNSSPTVCPGCDLLKEDPNGNIARCTRKRSER